MAEEFSGEKSEQATPRRREEARKKGQVAKSREIPSVLVLMTGLLVLFLIGGHITNRLADFTAQMLSRAGTLPITPSSVQALGQEMITFLLAALAPLLLAVLAMAVLANYIQVGTLFAVELIKPDFSKINIFKGLKRLFSIQSWVELLKSMLKLVIIGYVAYSTIAGEVKDIVPLTDQELPSIFSYISRVSFHIFIKSTLVMALLAGLDYLFQRFQHEKKLRMTHQELKEEFKQTEGDPLIKSRVRSLQREMARRRMMAEVPKADVIITNPTPLAVAVTYRNGEMVAPQVSAKGANLLAEKIKEIARSHEIPILENKPLAQTLFKTVELGQMIPPSLYQVVAEVLAYVYRLKNKRI
jgi:flagellar biosynthetic protein FlhB